MIQGSEEWHQARLGRVTASRVADVIAKTKSGWAASRTNYAAELIAERLTGASQDRYTNAAMQWGVETEMEARAAYEFYHGCEVAEVGFIEHPTIVMAGASPDGLAGVDGLIEIKCPNTSNHIDTLLNRAVPGKYHWQMMWQMACTGRQWCDFVSYDPRLPEDLRLFVRRVDRNDEEVEYLETEVTSFLCELEETLGKLEAIRSRPILKQALERAESPVDATEGV